MAFTNVFYKRDLGVSFDIDLQYVFEYQNVYLLSCVKNSIKIQNFLYYDSYDCPLRVNNDYKANYVHCILINTNKFC